MNFEAPSQKKINADHERQRSRVLELRDRVFEFTGDNKDERLIRDTIGKVLTENGITERASRVFYTNQVFTAIKNRLRAIEKKARDGKLGPVDQNEKTEPLYEHPVLGSNQ